MYNEIFLQQNITGRELKERIIVKLNKIKIK